MLLQDALSLARQLTFTDPGTGTTAELPNQQALDIFNIVYHNFINSINTSIDPEYFLKEITINLVAGQSEYDLSSLNVQRILGASIKNQGETYYRRMYNQQIRSTVNSLGFDSAGQSTDNPYYIDSNSKITVYPTPANSITGGLKLYVIPKILSLTLSDLTSEIPNIPSNYHETLVIGMKQHIYSRKEKTTLKDEAKNEYDGLKIENLDQIRRDRNTYIQSNGSIIGLARNMTDAPIKEISNQTMVDFANIIYLDLVSRIASQDQNYFYEKWTTDLVAGQNEYTLETPNVINQTFGQNKIEYVGIKYSDTQTYFNKAEKFDYNDMDRTPDYYEKNVPETMPRCIISDQSIFIYPTPTTSVSGGLVMGGSRQPYEITIDTIESEMIIPSQYRRLVAFGMKQFIYGTYINKNKDADSLAIYEKLRINTKNEYDGFVKRMLQELSSRWLTTTKAKPINLSPLE